MAKEFRQQTCADVVTAATQLQPGRPVFVRIVGGPDAGAVYPVTHIIVEADQLMLIVAP